MKRAGFMLAGLAAGLLLVSAALSIGSASATGTTTDCLSDQFVSHQGQAGQQIDGTLKVADIPNNIGVDRAKAIVEANGRGGPWGDLPVVGVRLVVASDEVRGRFPAFLVAQAGPPGEIALPGGITGTMPCLDTFVNPTTGEVIYSFAIEHDTQPGQRPGGEANPGRDNPVPVSLPDPVASPGP